MAMPDDDGTDGGPMGVRPVSDPPSGQIASPVRHPKMLAHPPAAPGARTRIADGIRHIPAAAARGELAKTLAHIGVAIDGQRPHFVDLRIQRANGVGCCFDNGVNNPMLAGRFLCHGSNLVVEFVEPLGISVPGTTMVRPPGR